jgi:hypothetical protein
MIHPNDWALYAGVEFGNTEYVKSTDSVMFTASCGANGGTIEVWLDSLDTGTKIAECNITNTGGWSVYKTFTAGVTIPVSGNHDVYLKFCGAGTDKLLMLKWLQFVEKPEPSNSINEYEQGLLPLEFELAPNFPNLSIGHDYQLSVAGTRLPDHSGYDLCGRKVATVVEGVKSAGNYTVNLNADGLAGGVYLINCG